RRYWPWFFAAASVLAYVPIPDHYRPLGDIGPAYFFPRALLFAISLAGLRFAEMHFIPFAKSLVMIGRESLVAYRAHLYLLYGSALNPQKNLLKILGPERERAEVAIVMLALIAAMMALCWTWHHLKQDHSSKARGLQLSLVGLLVYAFITG